ncbi:MAG: bacterial Ig-like domain-containing protein [Acetobacter sp.]|nr:bacterial Ig-like domain-containing protein [Bacteroides sp.]MCM1340109.1 bacterial Ig-like domain-containing protein [Acetobacter sp.]MCM1432692.1 bacterial Ig-like domain-containing protein [Clostridiales bacterium]
MKRFQKTISVFLSLVILISINVIMPVQATAVSENAMVTTFSSMLSRADAVINYEWTPKERIYTWNDNLYNGRNYFEAGEKVRGMPYTLFSWELGFDSLLSLEQYKTKSSDNYSISRYCNSVSDYRLGPAYGNCCATLVSEIFGGKFMNGTNPRYDGVGTLQDSTYSRTYTKVKAEAIQPGDALSCTSGAHVVWVGDVTDKTITIYESTPPICQKVVLDKSNHTDVNGYLTYNKNTYNIVTKSNEIIRDDLEKTNRLLTEIPMPVNAYTKSSEKTIVYDSINGAAKTNKIYPTDLCFIDAVFDNGWCHVNFPIDTGGLDHGYVKTSLFFNDKFLKDSETAKSNITVYSKSTMSEIAGRIQSGTVIHFADEASDAYCVFYPLTTGGYQLGWISKDDLSKVEEEAYLNQFCPIKGYPCASKNFEVKKIDYTSRGGEIYTTDYCTVNEIYSDGWSQVTFPLSSGGTLTGYTPLSNFIYDTEYEITPYITTNKIDVYTKKDLQQCNNWWTGIGDTIYILGEYDAALQICYPIDEAYGGGYKLGWIPRSSVDLKTDNPQRILTDISIESLPDITEYSVGENFTSAGLALMLEYSDGSTEIISNGFELSLPDMSAAGEKTVTVLYEGKTASFNITVNDSVKILISISINSKPQKLIYEMGEELDKSGLTLKLLYNDGTTEVITDGFTVSLPDMSSEGTKTVTVSYGGKSATFKITVNVSKPIEDLPVIRIESKSARAGETITVNVAVENNPGFSTASVKFVYDETKLQLTEAKLSNEFETGANVSYDNLPYLTFVKSSDINSDINMLTLTFKVLDTAQVGNAYISLEYSEGDISDSQENDVNFKVIDGNISIVSYLPGDINDDGKVNTKDLTRLLKYINHEDVECNKLALDVNGDGKINTKDLTRLLKYINHEDVEIF